MACPEVRHQRGRQHRGHADLLRPSRRTAGHRLGSRRRRRPAPGGPSATPPGRVRRRPSYWASSMARASSSVELDVRYPPSSATVMLTEWADRTVWQASSTTVCSRSSSASSSSSGAAETERAPGRTSRVRSASPQVASHRHIASGARRRSAGGCRPTAGLRGRFPGPVVRAAASYPSAHGSWRQHPRTGRIAPARSGPRPGPFAGAYVLR